MSDEEKEGMERDECVSSSFDSEIENNSLLKD